jgi:alpha-tubulin suppressor-like RCC1 family protein
MKGARMRIRRMWLASAPALTCLSACSDAGRPVVNPPPELGSLVVSDSASAPTVSAARHRSSGGTEFAFAAQTTSGDEEVAYVSLAPASYPTATVARIHSPRITGTVTALMVEGGLDPVAVPATAGDSIEIEILTGGVTLARTGSKVPTKRRPRVIRTIPPRGKTDVAVNGVIVIVFSEPISASSVSSSSIQLLRGTIPVAGTPRLLEGVTAGVAFQSAEPLSANTTFRLVVRPEVRDLDGDPLEQEVAIEFTTGSTFAPEVTHLTVLPDITALNVGSRVQLTARAGGGDDTTRVPISIDGVPLLWTSENSAVAFVSSAGLVSAVAQGETRIRAHVLTNPSVVGTAVIQVGSIAPVASLELSPPADTVPLTGKIEMVAVTKDAAGIVLPFQPMSWSTSNSSIATVEQAASGKAWVMGVSPGTVSIVATSQGRSDTTTVEVVSPGAYQTVSAGTGATCGLRGSSWAFCWGENSTGKVGDGSANSWILPRAVSRGLRFVQISIGGGHTCAITAAGEAYCWGANALGALGIGNTSGPEQCEFAGPCSRTPIAVSGGRSYSEIRANEHSGWYQFACGLTPSGAAYCWGANVAGVLGIGTATGPGSCTPQGGPAIPCSTLPVEVSGGHVFTSLALGDVHACALSTAGDAYCWGQNLFGQLGDGTETNRSTPVVVIGGLQFVSLTAGAHHTCGLTTDGRAYCWGASGLGALGHGAFEGPDFCQNPDPFNRPFPCSTAPEPVTGDLRFTAITAGEAHTCAVTSTGTAYCWGFNGSGQLGNATTTNSASPVAVVGGLAFANLSTGRDHSCGVTTGSLAYCWGFNGNFALGTDDQLPGDGVPVRVEGQP